jgi:peroxiredoxin
MRTFVSLALLPALVLAAPGETKKDEAAFLDCKGGRHTPKEWRGHKAVVVFFLNTECPVSNHYAPEMARLARDYADKGVLFWGAHPDPELSAADAARHAREYGLTFLILLDPGQRLAARTGVKVTPEVALLSPEGKVLYRGRIDDRYTPDGKRRDEPSAHDLEDAIKAVLAGKTPPVAETKAFGCPLPKVRKP